MIDIGGRKFHVPTPNGMRSFALQQRIIPVAGRVAGVFVSLLGSGDMATLAEMDLTAVLPTALPHIGHIFSEMAPGELEAITRELLRDAKASLTADKEPTLQLFGTPGGDAFDSLMQGRTTETWQLLWHALEVWYPDFFARVRGLTAASGARANGSAVSATSTGSGQASASL